MEDLLLLEAKVLVYYSSHLLIYGNKDGDGDHYQYEIVPKKPLNQNPGAAPNSLDWLVYIQRIKMKSLEAIGKKVGLITFNEIPMIGRKC